MEKSNRRFERYRVHLAVRYTRAREFVIEYAENLSVGGLFIKGAHGLESRQEVDVALDLPGFGQFDVTAEVAHLIDAETARLHGRQAGAGLAIVKSPPGFEEALMSYLRRLGRRADSLVFVVDETIGLLVAAAGYQVREAPRPTDLVAAIARAEAPVIAVVVSPKDVSRYETSAIGAGAGDMIIGVAGPDEFDALLVRLDESL